MERPTWATVVGILGIVFSCFGLMGAGSDIIMPKVMDVQKEMFMQMEAFQAEVIKSDGADQNVDARFFEIFKSIGKMWETPEWFGVFSVTTGIIKLIISGLTLFACIRLLQLKPSAITLFYWGAGLNIGLVVFKLIVALFSISFMAMMFGGIFGVVVYIVLIIVVASGDKASFYRSVPPPIP